MTLADDIIARRMPDFDYYISQGESLDDLDKYGFTPLIECAITRQPHIAELLLARGVEVNKGDVTGRTPLHWAVDNEDVEMVRLLLNNNADPNAYTTAGLSVLVYPLLRRQDTIKYLLYQHGAKIDFAHDFINAKLIGHRYELTGDVDIVNAAGEFIELNYEGFIPEFTVAVVRDSLRRFTSNYLTKHLRFSFYYLANMIDAFAVTGKLLQFQHHVNLTSEHKTQIAHLMHSPLLVLPAASRGHAIGFVRYGEYWAKIDRGENSRKEGSVILYRMTQPDEFNLNFLLNFLYKKQSRQFFHQHINRQLGLEPVGQLPLSPQVSGNCSWANIQGIIAAAYALQQLAEHKQLQAQEAMHIYEAWVEWDKDRALDECIRRFKIASVNRQASIAAILGAILFQACNYANSHHVKRAEKILTILTLPDYYYVLQSYLDAYCINRFTRKGNNLLKILDDCGFNPNIGITPIATGLKD